MRLGTIGSNGFTLLELMLVLGLCLAMAAWALPSLNSFMRGMQVSSASNHFVRMLESERHRSLVLPGEVTICGTSDNVSCDKSRGRRIVVFRDDNENGRVDAGEHVDAHEDFIDRDDFWLVWASFQNKNYLRWAAGRTDSMNGTFTVCNAARRDSWLRQVIVNRAGRTRIVNPAKAGGSVLLAARQRCGW